jgi:hypothetical protein
MQLRTPIAVVIYLASYLPLSVILLTQDLASGALSRPFCRDWLHFAARCEVPLRHPILAAGVVAVCTACFLFSLFTLWLVKPKNQVLVKEARHVPADLMNYVLPYVVSFMSLDYNEPAKFLGFLVFFAWIFLITHKSGQIIMNPVLTVFGWRLYEVSYEYLGGNGKQFSAVALSAADLETDSTHRQVAIQDVLIIK